LQWKSIIAFPLQNFRGYLSLTVVVRLSPAGVLGGISEFVLKKGGRNQSICSAEGWEESVSLFCRKLGGISEFVLQKVEIESVNLFCRRLGGISEFVLQKVGRNQ
jgi:hypothetical protein